MPDDVKLEEKPPQAVEITPPPTKPRPDLVAGADVTPIVPRTIEEVFRVARAVVTAGLAPDSYTRERGADLPAEEVISRVVIGIMKGAEVGFPPITALSTIAIINKRPCIWGEGAVALIQSRGVLEKMKIEYFGAAPGHDIETGRFGSDFGCRVTMWRRGQTEPYVGEFTVGDAKRAHLWMNPKRVPWIEYPKRQMKWRAFSFPAKDGFADCLMGISIREEIEDLPAEAPARTNTDFLEDAPSSSRALPAPSEKPFAAPDPSSRETGAPAAGAPAASLVTAAEPPQTEPKPKPSAPARPRKAADYPAFVEAFVAWLTVASNEELQAYQRAHADVFLFIRENRPADQERIDLALDGRSLQ